jgi:SEC-C motif
VKGEPMRSRDKYSFTASRLAYDFEMSSPTPRRIEKSSGGTPSEKYLERLCEKNFLSLWSYPRPFRDQGGGKELCDLLVVCGDDVIIFSDKHCVLEPKTNLDLDWKRWFRSAVSAAADQARGAERWLRNNSHRVFVDPECRQPLPVSIPTGAVARFHLVVTVHGVSGACRRMLGGTGSLMLNSGVRGVEAHLEPFVIGDLDAKKTFVHVLDDTSMAIVMSTLDTISDFVTYLRKKETLLRSKTVIVSGEEDLLGYYLMNADDDGNHTFAEADDADTVMIEDGWWSDFVGSDQRARQVESDRISYQWDALIETFARHAASGTQYFQTEPALESAEKILQIMAREPRFNRRALAHALFDAMERTPIDQRFIRLIPSQERQHVTYLFLIFPWLAEYSTERNREVRRHFLQASAYVTRLKHADATDIVGIATECLSCSASRSEDALYFDTRQWSPDDESVALEYQRELKILTQERQFRTHLKEYPDPVPKNPRNKLCFCGSGRKYKQCHLRGQSGFRN